jgi:predicted nucleotidyltransferase
MAQLGRYRNKNMNIEEILKEFRQAIIKLYGDRLSNVILYGSWARGEATEESDIDIMVVLKNIVSPSKEIDRMIDIITDINLKYNTLISVFPISDEDYPIAKSPLLINVKKEGVFV